MFGFGKNKFLGVDIGTSAIKVVEIKIENNKPILSNYAWMKLNGAGSEMQRDFSETALIQYLKKILSTAKFRSAEAYVSMPSSGGLVTLIELPEMSKADLDQAIKFEAHKYIPTALDDIALSWDVISKKNAPVIQKRSEGGEPARVNAPSEAKLQVLLVAAPKNKVAKYEKMIHGAGLSLHSIEIESFALLRALVGNDAGNFVLVDMGSRVCNIVLVEKGVIKVNRNIDAGGRDITKLISRGFNVDTERAENLKIEGGSLFGKESGIKLTTLDLIIDEVKRVLQAYYKNEGEKKVDGVILSGGTAGLEGIEKYFSESLGIKAVVGNPLGRIGYDPKLKAKLAAIGPQMTVSIGLALKGVEEFLKK